MRSNIVAGNWKMNLDQTEAQIVFNGICSETDSRSETNVIIFPPAIYLADFSSQKPQHIQIGAQNFYPAEKGAFTGEISYSQLQSFGVNTVLIGHSERRAIFNESNEFLKQKVDVAIKNGMQIVFCCGEPLEVRQAGEELAFVENQLKESLFHLNKEQFAQVVIAYEPVWAIGTGLTASVQQAEDMHASIRSWVESKYDHNLAENTSILYGGSCNESNAKELFSCPNVDGGLIGGASLKVDSFIQIVNSL